MEAIDLKGDFVEAYYNLGTALRGQKKHAASEAAFRKAIELKPNFAKAHHNLGSALIGQQRFGEAEVALRRVINAQPDIGMPHFFLARALMRQGRFDEAAAVMKKVADSLPAQDARRVQALQLQQVCHRWLLLDTRLPAILRGKDRLLPGGGSPQAGFSDQSQFTRHFRRLVGVTPGQFRMPARIA